MRLALTLAYVVFLAGCDLVVGVGDLNKQLANKFELGRNEVAISYQSSSGKKSNKVDLTISFLNTRFSDVNESARFDIANESAELAAESIGLASDSRIVVLFIDIEKILGLIPKGMNVVSEHKYVVNDGGFVKNTPNKRLQPTGG
ncbi:hypothetical protein [Simiduia aestuariiviva]|uniref:Lipoprotein n=1 Tax=Simiduia aestuariiviva TaxID=1510459 RepID=A0A839UPD6_9GAMM|nr:hypothetical protein [Simiduia aestuariiviva]MBB3167297.1 hypothetical protein [Simiduia aestuariiviva]